MLGALQTARIRKTKAARRFAGALLAAFAWLVFTAALSSEAQACPPSAKLTRIATVAHTLKRIAQTGDLQRASLANPSAQKKHTTVDTCCGGAHASSNCQGACSSVCTVAALPGSAAGLLTPGASKDFDQVTDAPFHSADTPPQFKPPRITA
jgi:hypothetical protein